MLSSSLRQIRKRFVRSISDWADAGTRPFPLAVNVLALISAWIFVPLERKYWRGVRARRRELYPHVNFDCPTASDVIRIFLQSVLLCVFSTFDWRRFRADNPLARVVLAGVRGVEVLGDKIGVWGTKLLFGIGSFQEEEAEALHPAENPAAKRFQSILIGIALFLVIALALLCITQPFNFQGQAIFLSIMLVSAWSFTHVKARVTLMVLFVISVTVSGRYLWWRCTQTLHPQTAAELFFSLLLLLAEIYAFIVTILGYFQVCWVLNRKLAPMPEDRSAWPTVDIFIPTYNESIEVVKPTVYAALNLDWPKDRIRVHLLDDGSRRSFAEFAESLGVNYIQRDEHRHAKAGNINHALGITSGEFIVVFDCDHVPSCDFLAATVGWLIRDEKIALVQTPHHFYSPDPFEKNLHLERAVPIENSLFHDFIQKGNDTWNAVMFCGSSAVMRRRALEEIGGIAVETVTEDAHTSLKLNRRGWKSAFISRPVASGLSTESLSAHIGQRIRWARGMIQIFRLDNPLFGKGLSIPQRLCFFNAMFHFLHGFPRLVFLAAPLPYMFADIYVIYATAASIFAYVIPHMVHAALTNQILQRGYRCPFLGGVYETVLSWYILLPTAVALIFPHKGKFNVTAKGMTIGKKYVDWGIAKPVLVLIALNFAGLCVGIYKTVTAADSQFSTLAINIGWILYNLTVLGAAAAVAVEEVQKHRLPRVPIRTNVIVCRGGSDEHGEKAEGCLREFSQNELRIAAAAEFLAELSPGDSISVEMSVRGESHVFDARVLLLEDGFLEAEVLFRGSADEIALNRCTFSREGIWTEPPEGKLDDRFVAGFLRLVGIAAYGYRSLLEFLPGRTGRTVRHVFSLLPRIPQAAAHTRQQP